MDDINKNNNTELNSLPTESTSKNTELDIFVDLLRLADISNTKNEKEDRLNAIHCYEKALFGDGINFKGIFIETIFITLADAIGNYVRHYFDFSIIENFLEKINNAVKERGIIEDDRLHIFGLTKVFDIAIANQLTDKIVDLVEKVKIIYHLENRKQQEEFCNSLQQEDFENQILDDDETGLPKVAIGRLLMRIIIFDYIQVLKNKELDNSKKRNLKVRFNKLVELVFEEEKNKKKEKEKLSKMEDGFDQLAMPFCNIILSWITPAKIVRDNYRSAMPRLYYAINLVFGAKYDEKDAKKYDTKSFLLKTILNIQLKRIAVRVAEEDMAKAREYFFTLLENLFGIVPSEKEQERLTIKYAGDESFYELKDKLLKSFTDVLLNDASNKYINEHRSSFLKGIIDFCDDTLDLIKERDSVLYKRIKDIFKLFADLTYDKLFSDGKIKNPEIGLDNYYQAYYCAEIFYAISGGSEENQKLNTSIEIAKQFQIYSNAKDEQKVQLKERLLSLEIRRASHKESNLDALLSEYNCESAYDLVKSLNGGKKLNTKPNRQAYYDILNDLYIEKKLDNDNLEIIKEGLSESKFSSFLINRILTNRESINEYRDIIIQFILSHAALLEANLNGLEIPETIDVSDEALTLLVLQVLPKTLNDIKENELKEITEIICDNFESEFKRKDATVHFAILQLLNIAVIKKNSLTVMPILMKRMTKWRINYQVDNEILKLIIYFLWNCGLSSKGNNISIGGIKGRLAIFYNPYLAQNAYNLIKKDKVLKAHINDYIYRELMDIINDNTAKLYSDKHVSNLLNTVYFQLELGKINDAEKTFEKAKDKNDNKKFGNKFTGDVNSISKLINEAKEKANKGISRFSGDKTLVDDWINIDIRQKRNEHNTEPVYEIFRALRNTLDSDISALLHSTEWNEVPTKDYIKEIRDTLCSMLANPKIPYEFGRALYDFCFSETWSYQNVKYEQITKDSVTKFEKVKNIKTKTDFNHLISVDNPYQLLEDINEERCLIPLSPTDGDVTFERKGARISQGNYRTYLPSIRKALSHMAEETKKHTVKGKKATLWLQVRYGSNDQDQKTLLIYVINPYADNKEFTLNQYVNSTGGSVQIEKALWGLCDFAVEKRYKNGDGTWHTEHENILGQIEDTSNREKSWPENDDVNVAFRYIIKIKFV